MYKLLLLFILFFTVKSDIFFEETPENTNIMHQCPNLKYNLKHDKCDGTRFYIFDFSTYYFSSIHLFNIKYLLKESVNNWFNQKNGTLIKIGTIYGLSFNNHSFVGFQECKNVNDCNILIENLKYENVTQPGWDYIGLLNTDPVFSLQYLTYLGTIFKTFFTRCSFNAAFLLTNRIINVGDVEARILTQICVDNCVNVFFLLLGRNETEATKDLENNYSFIPGSHLFNVPDYNCVITNLISCIVQFDAKNCTNLILNQCQPLPTPTHLITTTELINTFHITYILGFSSNVDQFDFVMALQGLINPLQEVSDKRPINVNFIVSTRNITQNIRNMKEFNSFVKSIKDFVAELFMDGEEFLNRIKFAIKITQFEIGNEKRMLLLTDYFPTSNISQNVNNLEMLKNSYLQIYVYNYTAYEIYEQNNISCNYLSNYSSQIPLLPTVTTSTKVLTTSPNVKNTVTSSTKKAGTTEITTTSSSTTQKSAFNFSNPKSSGENNKEKIMIIIICCGIIGCIIIILCISVLLYRRQLQRRKLQKIRLSHQNPENIDKWELTWDKLMIKNEELGSGAFGQVLQGKLLTIQKSKNGKIVEENEEVAIKILQRYTNEISEKNFLHEIQTMKQINGHKNIIEMIGCVTVGDRICLVLEFCPYRDLLQYAKTKYAEITTFFDTADHIRKEFLIFAWQISLGMQFLASEGIIHRDLAARNILINKFKIAKISDFGICVQINDKLKNSLSNNIVHLETGKLPLKWLAIESLKNYEFSLQSDIWAFGIILYEMYSFGEIPFSEIEVSKLIEHLEAGKRPEKPAICPDEIYIIMKKCWTHNPSFRPLIDELITIFKVFLERSTENYGYISKADIDDKKDMEKIICYD